MVSSMGNLQMSRPKAKAPARRYHLSGQSVVTLDGKDFYLGIHDSPVSIARYAVLIATYQQNGFRLPDSLDMDAINQRASILFSLDSEPQRQDKEPITVKHVTGFYREFAKNRHTRKNDQELIRANQICDELDKHEGGSLVDEFGPLALQRQRDRWVKSGRLSRRYVNRQVNLIIRIFKVAVSQELVKESTWQRLKSVEPLRRGQTTAAETELRMPVNIESVRATAKHLSPIVRDMVRVVVSTGLRPSEICNLRPIDIDRSNADCWMFRPAQHKTANKGIRKAVPLVGDAREAIEDHLNRRPESYCFSPKEAVAWMQSQKRAARKSPVQPSQVDRSKPNPRKQAGDRYDAQSLNRAIKTACKKANVDPWTPYQLRHLAATAVRDAIGIEYAQALLGHREISMTEHYTRTAEQKSIEAAQHTPKL